MAPQPKSQMDQLKEALARAKRGKDRGYIKDPFAWPGPKDADPSVTDQILFEELAAPFTNFGNPVKVTKVRGPDTFEALAFRCHLNVDNDGAPTCHVPPDSRLPRLDGLGSAKSNPKSLTDFRWVGLVAYAPDKVPPGVTIDQRDDAKDLTGAPFPLKDKDGKYPVKQRLEGRLTGYYVSKTSTSPNPGLPEWDQRRYWDATQIRYGTPLGRLAEPRRPAGRLWPGDRNQHGPL
jgi:hypothetical protein